MLTLKSRRKVTTGCGLIWKVAFGFSISFLVQVGLVSTWLERNLVVGGEVQFRGVDGDFTLDKAAKCIPPAGEIWSCCQGIWRGSSFYKS